MPFVGVRRDHLLTQGEELVADHVERLVETAILERCVMSRFDKLVGDGAFYGPRSTLPNELADGSGVERFQIVAEVRGANHFALVHWDAADELGAIFGEQHLGQQRLGLTERALGIEVGCPPRYLPHQLGIGCVPAEAVNDVLLLIGALPVGLAVRARDPSFDGRPGA